MMITSQINMDLAKRPAPAPVDVVQEDRNSRSLEIALFSGGIPWLLPEGIAVRVRYCKADGIGGEYDTLPDGTKAWSAVDNVLTIALAPQVLTVPGPVRLMVEMIRNEQQISTFGILLSVHPKVSGAAEKSASYLYMAGLLPAPAAAKAGQYIRVAAVDDNNKVTQTEAAEPQGTVTEDTLEAMTEQVADILFSGVAVEDTEYQGFYMEDTQFKTSDSQFRIYQIPVTKGEVYRVQYPRHNGLSPTYGAIGFSKNTPVADVEGENEILLFCTTTETDIDFAYAAAEDGHLNVFASQVTERPDFTVVRDLLHYRKPVAGSLKIQLFGDSITDNQYGDKITWANFVEEYIPERSITLVNTAVSGAVIGQDSNIGNTESQQDKTYNGVWDLVTGGEDGTSLALETDSDVIVILVGTNDWANATPLGAFGDDTKDTVYGCLKLIIEYISQNTGAKLFLCTPPQRYNTLDKFRGTNERGETLNSSGNTLREYCDVFVEMSRYYGVPCIDLNQDLGWNKLNISRFSDDGLHPNVTGDQWIARLICSEIKKHMVHS